MNHETKKIRKKLRKLAKLMNTKQRSGLPVTDDLVDCFETAITMEECEFLTSLGSRTLKFDELQSLSGKSAGEFGPFAAAMLRKGILWEKRDGDGAITYHLPPILVGWFEFYLSDGSESPDKKEFARRLTALFNFWGTFNKTPLRFIRNIAGRLGRPSHSICAIDPGVHSRKKRRIEIQEKLDMPLSEVVTAGSVFTLIEEYGSREKSIALMHCFCRQWKKMDGGECRFHLPAEACITLGNKARYVAENGIGRYITGEQALGLVKEVQKKGGMHIVFHSDDDTDNEAFAICNCCWDCCGVIGSYNRGITSMAFKSFYLASADGALCTGCGLCEKYCPSNAITMADGKAVIDTPRCIGCGQCAYRCAAGAITLTARERDVFVPLLKKSEVRI